MTKKENIVIKDDQSLSWIPKRLRKLFIKSYQSQGFIYLMTCRGKEYASIEPTDVVKWLDVIIVETTSEKKADKMAHEYLNTNYPQYKERIYLY